MSSEKDCFGIMDRIFPKGEEGLREVVPGCMKCPERVECLRAALDSPDGIVVKSEMLDRAAESGMVGRIRRWSDKKHLHRQMKKQKKGDVK
jgi:hypothetical protein